MKNIRIVLILIFSILLSGCTNKEKMDYFTNNWWIALYVLGTIGFLSIYYLYSSSEPLKLCILTIICIILSVLYRCGYITVY